MMSLTVIVILLALGWCVRALWRAVVRALSAPPIPAVQNPPSAR